jgi:hypothetical protein
MLSKNNATNKYARTFLNFVCRYSVWTEQSPFMAWLLCDDDGAGISL